MKSLQILATIVGIVMSFGYYPQMWKIWKTKSAKDVSLLTYAILSVGTTVWTIYGIVLKDWVIFLSFVFGVIGSWSVLLLTLKYRHNEKRY